MDNIPDEKLNDSTSSKVTKKVTKSDSTEEKSPAESANLQNNNANQLSDKVIFENAQTQTMNLPCNFLREPIVYEKITKPPSPKSIRSKNFQRGHEKKFYHQYISQNNESPSTAEISPIKDSNNHVKTFPLPTSDQKIDTKPFIFGRPNVNVETKKFTFTLKHENNSRISSIEENPMDEDESLASILLCIRNLNLIISEAKKSKVIGIFDSSEHSNLNTIKSALLQLRLAPDKASWVNKCVFVSNNVPATDFVIRENILNGNEYDPQRYHSAIALSYLREDLKLFANGDKTVVGKNGIQLTDAHKEKLALARAFYANKDIYFFYDILNSIEETTGECIFQSLIQGALEEKIVVFITHSPMCLSRCDEVYVIKNGEVQAKGDHKSLLQTNEFYASVIKASTHNVFNKNVKISMKNELSSSERIKTESETIYFNIKILIIFFSIVLSLLYMLQHVSVEELCSYFTYVTTKIIKTFDVQ